MKRYFLSLALLCLVATGAHAYWQSRAQVAIVTGGGFVGPGDITAGAVAWWGLRAYSAAKRGTKVANVCNSTGGVDVGCADMLSDAVTGALVSQTISSITCPGANCTVKVLYDQSGTNSCTVNSVAAQPCDVGNPTVANRPTLVTTTMVFSGGVNALACDFAFTCVLTASLSQPYTSSAVAKRTGSTSISMAWVGIGTVLSAAFGASSGTIAIFAGATTGPGSIAENTFHAIQFVPNGSSGIIYIDGTNNTSQNMGTNAGSGKVLVGGDSFNNGLVGNVNEVGFWSGDQSANNSTMNSNQHTFWGF